MRSQNKLRNHVKRLQILLYLNRTRMPFGFLLLYHKDYARLMIVEAIIG